jgi:hypothetical protein
LRRFLKTAPLYVVLQRPPIGAVFVKTHPMRSISVKTPPIGVVLTKKGSNLKRFC